MRLYAVSVCIVGLQTRPGNHARPAGVSSFLTSLALRLVKLHASEPKVTEEKGVGLKNFLQNGVPHCIVRGYGLPLIMGEKLQIFSYFTCKTSPLSRSFIFCPCPRMATGFTGHP
jgi:hypothetical protein